MVANWALYDALQSKHKWGETYFTPWTYQQPLLVNASTNVALGKLQKIMYKMIVHFVTNYPKYEHLMRVSPAVKRIINLFEGKHYIPGSYRTDFVIDKNGHFKLIEITCRFAFNGIFLSGLLNTMAKKYAHTQLSDLKTVDKYEGIIAHIQERLKNTEVVILSHRGKEEESRFYQSILEEAGFSVQKVYADQIENFPFGEKPQTFITEFNQEEYFNLSDKTLKALANATVINDLRTVFLIHDKRFFSVMGNEQFRKDLLSEDEIALFDQFYIPTYAFGEQPLLWAEAKQAKDQWIIKHKNLGKSAQVYAGVVTSKEQWEALFEADAIQEMILQPFIDQKKFEGTISGNSYNDYVVGTLLFFNNHYFGPGLFRASSHPVTNVVDDRKLMHLILEEDQLIESYYTL